MTDDWDYIEKGDAANESTAAPPHFGHRLALALGVVNVTAMLRALSCSQYDEWYQFYRNNPWGYPVESFRAGQLCAVVANVSGRISRPKQASDFLPKLN